MPEDDNLPPYTQGFRSKDPKPDPAGSPAPGVETLDGINFEPRKSAPRIFKGPCMYSTTKGNVLVVSGNQYKDDHGELDRDPGAEACPVPMVIVDKMAKKLYDPDPPHLPRSHKYLKLKPVKVRPTYIESCQLKLDENMILEKWVEAVYCVPLEFKFKELWTYYTVGKYADPEIRQALVLGLKALREFGYPQMSEAELFLKICLEDDKEDIAEEIRLSMYPKAAKEAKEKKAAGPAPPVIPPEFQDTS
mmetsp:Transcript_39911/g.79889  ORF Transcript_39911/g.79889 Transcript_39911/m.79889 type:complete len:248 (-) Transcript_39911:195-938(-)